MEQRKFLDKQVEVAGLSGTAIFLLEYHFCYVYGLYMIEMNYARTKNPKHAEHYIKKVYEEFYIQYLEEHNYTTDLDYVKKATKLDCYHEYYSLMTTLIKRVQPEYKEMFRDFIEKASEISSNLL